MANEAVSSINTYKMVRKNGRFNFPRCPHWLRQTGCLKLTQSIKNSTMLETLCLRSIHF